MTNYKAYFEVPGYRQKLLDCLGRVATREEERAIKEFRNTHKREYDGSSDDDWDALDKDYTGVEEAMDIIRTL